MSSRVCGFCGCTNVVENPEYPWQMCDDCWQEALEIEDSEMPAVSDMYAKENAE